MYKQYEEHVCMNNGQRSRNTPQASQKVEQRKER